MRARRPRGLEMQGGPPTPFRSPQEKKKKEPPDSDISVRNRNMGSSRPSAWPHCGGGGGGVGRLTGAESDTNVKQTLISMFV